MSEVASLLLVLAAIYLLDCFVVIRRDAVVFRAMFRRRCTAIGGAHLPGTRARGVLLGNPLPPLGSVFVCRQWPVSISPDGVFAYVATAFNPGPRPPQAGEHVRHEEILGVEAEAGDLRVNGKLFMKTGSETMAAALAEAIGRIARLPRERREPAIVALLRSTMDAGAARKRVDELHDQTRVLRILCNAELLVLFVIAPGAIVSRGLAQTWLVLVGALLALAVSIALELASASKALRESEAGAGGAGRPAPLTSSVISILLSPPGAIRAVDLLSRDLLVPFHPAAVAAALCDPDEAKEVAVRALRDARHPFEPVCPAGASSEACATEAWHRQTLVSLLEDLVAREGVKASEITAQPTRQTESCRAWCPRCLTQYTGSTMECGDCGGLRLTVFR